MAATASTNPRYEGKVILCGESGSGKTSLVGSFARGEEGGGNPRPSIGVAYAKATVHLTVPEPATVELQLWDTAGTEKFRSVNTLYYRGAAAAIVVFDLTSRPTLAAASSWAEEVRRHTPPGLLLFLAGNKADLKAARAVSAEEGTAAAAALGARYCEVSARSRAGVAELFEALAAEAPGRARAAAEAALATGSKPAEGFKIAAALPARAREVDLTKKTPKGAGSGCSC